MRFRTSPGTHDVLDKDWPHWARIVREAERLARLYGYREIVTPVFEDAALFKRTSGVGSDVVQKEMYELRDRGERDLALRPEGTAPIARAYVEHGLHRDPQPVKLFTIAPMYRYAAPQKGRFREHWQLSVEAIGSDDPAVDAEVIQLYDTLLRTLGVTAYTLELNSIGDASCRPAFVERLAAWLDEHDAELDEDARAKRLTSPLRVFDTKSSEVARALEGAPRIGDSLCDACREHFARVREYLDAYGVRYRVSPTLVRGLDYYVRTTWEFTGAALGAQSSLSGGGRYDGLVEDIGGPSTPGVGFGAGLERLHLALEGQEPDPPALDVFFLVEPEADRAAALAQMARLRAAGIACDTDYAGRSLKGQRTQLSRSGARASVVVGPAGAVVRRGDDERRVEVDAIADTFLA